MAASVVASVALPISNNFSFAPSMDAYGKLSEYGKLGAWSPLSLFAASEVGAWYDPSDLTTMFQDSAGTTPVTADGQPVGLILDKSNGLAFGPELATNGDFSNGTTGWVPNTGVSLSNVSNQLVQTSTSIGWLSSFLHVTGVTPGNTYKISIDVVGGSVSSSRYINVGTNGGGYNIFQTPILSNGTLVCYATATLNYFDIGTECFFNNIGDTVILDNVSVKLISGNHASQATAAKRPLLQNDGVNNYLSFDGVDDALATAATIGIAAPPFVSFGGVSCNSVSSNIAIWSNERYISGINASKLKFTTIGVLDYYLDTPLLQNSTKLVSTTSFDTSFDCTFRLDGANQTVVAGSSDSAGGQGNLSIGAHSGTTNIGGNIYSVIILGRSATSQEITETETWVAAKTGVFF